eukprot:scaffold524502_cov18-Prasinocladus_malaysianus.AAC.1
MHVLLQVMRRNAVRYISLVAGIYLNSSVESYYTQQRLTYDEALSLDLPLLSSKYGRKVALSAFNKIQNILCILKLDEDLRLKDCHEIAFAASRYSWWRDQFPQTM